MARTAAKAASAINRTRRRRISPVRVASKTAKVDSMEANRIDNKKSHFHLAPAQMPELFYFASQALRFAAELIWDVGRLKRLIGVGSLGYRRSLTN